MSIHLGTTNYVHFEHDDHFFFLSVKRGFHETTKIYKIDHRRIQIDRWVLQTGRHGQVDIGSILAADETLYFIIGRQEN